MQFKKPVIYLSLAIGISGLGAAHAGNNHGPSADSIEFAERTSDLMTATVVAALVQEIGETTAANVHEGNLSIGLVFNDKNLDMRLVGELDPISTNDYPRDDFEEDALDDALAGQARTDVQRVKGQWYYRRSIPLSNFASQCQLCHANYVGLPATEWVGALMLRIPIDD